MVLLHGHLQVTICEAHDIGRAFYSKKSIFKSCFKGMAQNAKQAIQKTKHADRDCYVAVYAAYTKLFETRIIPRTGDPVWNEQHTVAVAHDVPMLLFLVKDHDRLSAEHVAEVRINAEDLLHKEIEGWFPLRNIKGRKMKGGGELKLKVKLIGIPQNPVYARGINAADPNSAAVEDSFFKERSGHHVVMYQDAHCGADLEHSILPNIQLADGHFRRTCQTNAIMDMWRAMENAQQIIYIINWHFNPETKNPFDEGLPNIGELLKRKSEQGVRVNIIIWDEIDSGDDFLAYTRVSKMLHGGGATGYFKDTEVSVKLMPRKSHAPQGIERIVQERFGFAHHQKTMLVDQDWQGQRFLTAYMGGLDFIYLCYDTCAHKPGGRRYEEGTMPWHDCHCCVTGPAAWDVLEAYEQQWLTLAEEYHDHLKDMSNVPGLARPDQPAVHERPGDRQDWRVQIFRSMDSSSSNFKIDEDDANIVLGRGLGRGKGVLIDAGLHNMYVHTIRRAKHMVYIENQFFTGSSFAWSKYTDSQADNLVPIEIALRIVYAIEHDERFAAYLVIPLHPERPGPQRSSILLYTWHTIAMMYRVIGEALQRRGDPNAHPSDYLNFYCLANRQKPSGANIERNSGAEKAGASPDKSFIHIHAKTIIQDDEYVSISSANLNQRSLDGQRDTELGMGAWQPAHTLATASSNQSAGGTNNGSGQHGGGVATGSSPNSTGGAGGDYSNSQQGGNAQYGGGSANGDYSNSQYSGGNAQYGSGNAQYGSGNAQYGIGNTNGGYSSAQFGGGNTHYGSGNADGGYSNGQNNNGNVANGPGGAQHLNGVSHNQYGNSSYSNGAANAGTQGHSQYTQPGGVSHNQEDQSGLQGAGHTKGTWQPGVDSQRAGQQGQRAGWDQPHDQRADWDQPQRQPEEQGQRGGSGPGQSSMQDHREGQEAKVPYPKGEVYGYRMALWLEHLGGKYDPVYDQPHSLACVKQVNYLAEQNWLQFSGEEDCDMTGHLITFPCVVDKSGAITPRTKDGHFSDIDNDIQGKKRPIPAMFVN